jgi:hypothetical protein
MIAAQKTKPHFLIVCQWNEFAGAPDGSPSYADSYNVSLSNDMEPTSLTECGHVRKGDRACGGWGFTYLNLLRATVEIFNNPDSGSSVIALQEPQPYDVVGLRDVLCGQGGDTVSMRLQGSQGCSWRPGRGHSEHASSSRRAPLALFFLSLSSPFAASNPRTAGSFFFSLH